jgi:hypothetical protein
MKQKLIERNTKKIIQNSVNFNYDHGYYGTLYELSKLTIVDTKIKNLEKFYGGKYTIISEVEEDDKYCPCCNRNLKKSDIMPPEDPHYVILTELYKHDDFWIAHFVEDMSYVRKISQNKT